MSTPDIDQLRDELRAIYDADPERAATARAELAAAMAAQATPAEATPAPAEPALEPAVETDLLALVNKIPALRWRTLALRYGVDFEHVDQDLILMCIIGANELHRKAEGRDALERFEAMPLDELTAYIAERTGGSNPGAAPKS